MQQPSPSLFTQKEEAAPWVLVRHRVCWADEFDCSGLAVMPADDWTAQLARLRAECRGPVEATAGRDAEVDSSYADADAYLASCFSITDFPAAPARELARSIGTGRMHGTVMRPGAAPWFLTTRLPVELPEAEPAEGGWCLVLFAHSWQGMPLQWLGLLPTRSWHATLARVRTGRDEEGEEVCTLDAELEASFGTNESVTYDGIERWLARFTAWPVSDDLARALLVVLGDDRPGPDDSWVRTASIGLLPRPAGLWHALEIDAPRVPTGACYRHGTRIDACRVCMPNSTPRKAQDWAPELLALGGGACTQRFAVSAWTDMPFPELGDVPGTRAPERECTVLSWDRDRYAVVSVDDPQHGTVVLSVKAGYLYTARGRQGDVPCLPVGTLAELPREPVRMWRLPAR